MKPSFPRFSVWESVLYFFLSVGEGKDSYLSVLRILELVRANTGEMRDPKIYFQMYWHLQDHMRITFRNIVSNQELWRVGFIETIEGDNHWLPRGDMVGLLE